MSTTDLEASVAAALTDRYNLPAPSLARVGVGQNTINLRARIRDGREMFVKTYPASADLDAEREAISLSERAGRHGVPVAALVSNRDGQLIDTGSPVAISVWEWVPGQVVTDLDDVQCSQAGRALGRIHTAFADLLHSTHAHDTALRSWRAVDIPALTATIDRLLEVIDEHTRAGHADEFDEVAVRTLTERRTMLAHLPPLCEKVGDDLTVQVVHGDFSPVNLLYTDSALSAVLDFCPPRPDVIAYDLGRMAFYPHTITGGRDWLALARTCIAAYLEANPQTSGADVRACGPIALIQLLRSLYGVKQHYLKPGLDQNALDDFWILRHQAARTLLEQQSEIAQMLDELARHL